MYAPTRLDDKPRTVQVALDVEGKIFVDGAQVALESLSERLRASLAADQAAPEMHLPADRKTAYERVTIVMAAAQQVGITKIAFATEAAAGSGTP